MSGKNGAAAGHIDVKLLDRTGGHMDAKSVFPGWEGLPFKGPVPNLKEADGVDKQPQVGMKVHIEYLDLSKPKDQKKYQQVCQTIANGYGQLSKEDMRFDEKKKSWRVFLRWVELFAFDPTKGNAHGYGR
jgi:hypothetical protein